MDGPERPRHPRDRAEGEHQAHPAALRLLAQELAHHGEADAAAHGERDGDEGEGDEEETEEEKLNVA